VCPESTGRIRNNVFIWSHTSFFGLPRKDSTSMRSQLNRISLQRLEENVCLSKIAKHIKDISLLYTHLA